MEYKVKEETLGLVRRILLFPPLSSLAGVPPFRRSNSQPSDSLTELIYNPAYFMIIRSLFIR